jgi:hypothetical protein
MATLAHADKRWTVGGDYLVRLKKGATGWKTTAVTFDMKWQHGER